MSASSLSKSVDSNLALATAASCAFSSSDSFCLSAAVSSCKLAFSLSRLETSAEASDSSFATSVFSLSSLALLCSKSFFCSLVTLSSFSISAFSFDLAFSSSFSHFSRSAISFLTLVVPASTLSADSSEAPVLVASVEPFFPSLASASPVLPEPFFPSLAASSPVSPTLLLLASASAALRMSSTSSSSALSVASFAALASFSAAFASSRALATFFPAEPAASSASACFFFCLLKAFLCCLMCRLRLFHVILSFGHLRPEQIILHLRFPLAIITVFVLHKVSVKFVGVLDCRIRVPKFWFCLALRCQVIRIIVVEKLPV
mmetsp:Transcript_70377/g.135847  ORF Transcript_70377/g.135847 Transcript_70377/m.135847 type:complete len:318 (+) Transcript_70377:372-1325(+)